MTNYMSLFMIISLFCFFHSPNISAKHLLVETDESGMVVEHARVIMCTYLQAPMEIILTPWIINLVASVAVQRQTVDIWALVEADAAQLMVNSPHSLHIIMKNHRRATPLKQHFFSGCMSVCV